EIGSGETGRTTAHLTHAYDDRYYRIAALHGEKIAQLVAESHTYAIQAIEDIIQTEGINCDFKRVDGYLFLDPTHSLEILQKEYEATRKAGLEEVRLMMTPIINGFSTQPVLHFPRQAQFHPMKYLIGLAKAITKLGGDIYTNTAANEVKLSNMVRITTEQKTIITAENVVIATNAPIFDRSFSFAKQEPMRSYVIGALIPNNALQTALYWDTHHPYHYVRLQPYSNAENIIIIGGEDHRTGEKIDDIHAPFKALEAWGRQYFPEFTEVIYQWSGQVQEPTDLLAYIGQLHTKEKNVFIVTGDSGNGMTHGVIAGRLISDLILNKKNKWTKVYDPHRTMFKNGQTLLKHNTLALSTYLRYLTPGEVSDKTNISPGEGKIIRQGLQKVAIYRDDKGVFCEQSAVCTHMQAPLVWNPIEKTWDCPAHGSRFAPCGKVLQGPAKAPLKKPKKS
ncbi:MAG TPA: FAD-dependent oxidoreductase, partial [Legionellaceae bacterium]|nr:FAD-dependent oxidoreductase [Legionellaceae bacterium]